MITWLERKKYERGSIKTIQTEVWQIEHSSSDMIEEAFQLNVTFWGTRGSIPSPGKYTVKYGGNTTCVELNLNNNAMIIFDAGTGIKNLGQKIIKNGGPKEINLFFTHSHWDHIHGFSVCACLCR